MKMMFCSLPFCEITNIFTGPTHFLPVIALKKRHLSLVLYKSFFITLLLVMKYKVLLLNNTENSLYSWATNCPALTSFTTNSNVHTKIFYKGKHEILFPWIEMISHKKFGKQKECSLVPSNQIYCLHLDGFKTNPISISLWLHVIPIFLSIQSVFHYGYMSFPFFLVSNQCFIMVTCHSHFS